MNSEPTPRIARRQRTDRPAPRTKPNRLFELWRAKGWTADIVAERVRELAHQRGDTERTKTATGTINRLSSGAIALDQDWMKLLGDVLGVPAAEIIAPPPAEGLRRVHVTGALQAGAWAESHEWPEDERYSVMVPDDAALRGLSLYAGEIRGNSMNLRYSPGSIVILSPIMQHPGEIVEGRRYHVRMTHSDGKTEETIKTLVKHSDGNYWLKPESDDPAHQQWIALDSKPGARVELVGRVRGVYSREP